MGNAGTTRRRVRSGVPVPPEVAAWARACGGAAPGHVAALSAFVEGCQTDGVWPLMDYVYPLAGQNLYAAVTALKSPGGCQRLAVTAFADSDYTPTGGLTGGSGKRLTAPVCLYPTGDFHASVYGLTACTSSSQSCFFGYGSRYIYAFGTNLGTIYRSSDAANTTGTPPGDRVGLNVLSETGYGATCTRAGYFAGAAASTPAAITGNTVSASAPVLMVRGDLVDYSTGSAAGFFSFGRGLTAAHAALLSARVEALMVALGRKPATAVWRAAYDGLLMAGQSLGLGAGNVNNLTLRRPSATGDVMFPDSPVTTTTSRLDKLIRLTPTSFGTSGQGCSGYGTAYYARAAGYNKPLLVAGCPQSGTAYSGIASGTAPFNATMAAVRAAKREVEAGGGTFSVRAIVMTHGETDDVAANTSYQSNIETLRTDYDAAIKAVTGQPDDVAMIVSQMHTWAVSSLSNRTTPVVAQAQYLAWKANPSKIILACPKYMLSYDGSRYHLTSASYEWHAEYLAKALAALGAGSTPAPLAPLSVTRSGTNITAVFNKGGLAFDTTLVTDPSGAHASRKHGTAAGAATDSTVTNYKGFEFMDDATTSPSATITGHSVTTTNTANDTVVFSLSGTPTGTNPRLRAAWTLTTAAAASGPSSGPRCNLRDGDTSYVSPASNTMYNWCVTFDEPVV